MIWNHQLDNISHGFHYTHWCVLLNVPPEVQVLQARIPVAFSMEKQLLKAKEDQDFRQHSWIGLG